MKFKNSPSGKDAEKEFPHCHPELRALVLDLDAFSGPGGVRRMMQELGEPIPDGAGEASMPELVVTDLGRNEEEMVGYYVPAWKGLVKRLQEQDPKLKEPDLSLAKELRPLPDEELIRRAKEKYSWHLDLCALDLSQKPYAQQPALQALVVRYLKKRCQKPLWSVLVHTVTAPHIHVERRDFSWRGRHKGRNLNA